MQIIPMRELKNTVEIERRCAEENGPVFVTKNGYGRLVVMDIDYYERTMQEMEEAKLILEGLDDVEAGRTVDGPTAMAELRESMDCEYHYRLTRRAEKELDDILDYIGNKLDNAKAAAKLMEDIGHCMETVCVFPEGGALVTNAFLPRKIIRKKVVGNYLLYYRADKERKTVWLLRIVYGRRDMDEVLKHINS